LTTVYYFLLPTDASLKPDTIVLITIGNQQSVAIFIDIWRSYSYFIYAYKRKKCWSI